MQLIPLRVKVMLVLGVSYHFDEGQRPRRGVPPEDRHRAVIKAHHEDVLVIGADRHRPGSIQSLVLGVSYHLDRSQPSCGRIPPEDRHRVVIQDAT